MLSKYILNKYRVNGKYDAQSKTKIGNLCSYVALAVNLVLSAIKMITGLVFSSVSILADGINNLADAGNSIIVFFSFRLSSLEADEKHPYGHERYEYLASMVVGVSILFLCYELVKSSIDKMIHPQVGRFSILMVIVLLISILMKTALYFFYKRCGRAIDSMVLYASAQDSLNDVLSSSVILLGTLISYFFSFSLDGYLGIFVAILILFSGIGILKEATNKILGEAPNKEFVQEIEKKIEAYEGVLGIHDLIVHMYGPNRIFVCVHVEVDARVDILKSHDQIDLIEQDFLRNEGIHLVIHMDPIVVDNPHLNQLKEDIQVCVKQFDAQIHIHDFRAVVGQKQTKLIFDCVIPYHCKVSQDDLELAIQDLLKQKDASCYAVIQFERPYN